MSSANWALTYIRMGVNLFGISPLQTKPVPTVSTKNLEVKVMSLANISIVGNLVRQPEQVCLPSGRVKTTFVVAVSKRPKHGEKNASDFYTVVAWQRLGEVAGEFLSVGNQVTVCGRLVLDNWTDRQGRIRVTPVV